MAPLWDNIGISASQKLTQLSPAAGAFEAFMLQLQNPTGILAVLLLAGGDVVHRAVAQLAGGPYYFTPVAFSFGWVSFSISAVLSSMGDGRLMPIPETPSIIMNADNGHKRPNQSWILSRLLRDVVPATYSYKHAMFFSLCTLRNQMPGRPKLDFVMVSGLVVIVAQVIIACVPGILYGAWDILVVTGGGTVMALLTSGLPEWRKEKWAGRLLNDGQRKTICLTGGNGSNRVIVIKSEGGLDLESMASPRYKMGKVTKGLVVLFAVCWVVLLLLVAGIQENPWFLLAVGTIGMAQNVLAAGYPRAARAMGLDLNSDTVPEVYPGVRPDGEGPTVPDKLMGVLQEVERYHPKVGMVLCAEFFPGGMRENEIQYWDNLRQKYARDKALAKTKNLKAPVETEKNEQLPQSIHSDTSASRSARGNKENEQTGESQKPEAAEINMV